MNQIENKMTCPNCNCQLSEMVIMVLPANTKLINRNTVLGFEQIRCTNRACNYKQFKG